MKPDTNLISKSLTELDWADLDLVIGRRIIHRKYNGDEFGNTDQTHWLERFGNLMGHFLFWKLGR